MVRIKSIIKFMDFLQNFSQLLAQVKFSSYMELSSVSAIEYFWFVKLIGKKYVYNHHLKYSPIAHQRIFGFSYFNFMGGEAAVNVILFTQLLNLFNKIG